MNRRLTLKKETLTSLNSDELAGILGAGAVTDSCALCAFTEGNSCGGVCSGYCPSYTCPAALTAIVTQASTIL